jgi:hypothetical protein
MRVAHHHHVDAAGIELEIVIELGGLLAMTLEEAGVEEEPHAAAFEEVHRAGNLARRAVKGQLEIGLGEWG